MPVSSQWMKNDISADQAEKGILTKKEYGKQVIFVYNQVHPLWNLNKGVN